jgi:hypothetical protein
MSKPSHGETNGARSLTRPETSESAYASEVLLIADEPRAGQTSGSRRNNGRGRSAPQREPIEPLDMESVVQKLIALLSEDTLP